MIVYAFRLALFLQNLLNSTLSRVEMVQKIW